MQIHQGMETLRQTAPNLVNTFGVPGTSTTTNTTPSTTTTTSTSSTTQANTTTTQSGTTTTSQSAAADPFSEVTVSLCS